jgi:hypothetical protein
MHDEFTARQRAISLCLAGRTVFDDGAVDGLSGASGQDWVVASINGSRLHALPDPPKLLDKSSAHSFCSLPGAAEVCIMFEPSTPSMPEPANAPDVTKLNRAVVRGQK